MKTKENEVIKEKRIQYGDLSVPALGNEEMFLLLRDIRKTRRGNYRLVAEKHHQGYAEIDHSVGQTVWEKNPEGLLWVPGGTVLRNQ
jgi:uncharacterized protein YdbL (DUF1318 family)